MPRIVEGALSKQSAASVAPSASCAISTPESSSAALPSGASQAPARVLPDQVHRLLPPPPPHPPPEVKPQPARKQRCLQASASSFRTSILRSPAASSSFPSWPSLGPIPSQLRQRFPCLLLCQCSLSIPRSVESSAAAQSQTQVKRASAFPRAAASQAPQRVCPYQVPEPLPHHHNISPRKSNPQPVRTARSSQAQLCLFHSHKHPLLPLQPQVSFSVPSLRPNSLSAFRQRCLSLGFNVALHSRYRQTPPPASVLPLSQAVSSVGGWSQFPDVPNVVSNAVGTILSRSGRFERGPMQVSLASSFPVLSQHPHILQHPRSCASASRLSKQRAPGFSERVAELQPYAFSSANSLSALGNVAYQLGFNVANTLGIGNAPGLGAALSQAVSSVGVGASSSTYANVVSNAVGQFLAGQGVLNAANAGSLASSFASALSNSALSIGSRVSSPSYGAFSPIAAGPNSISTGLNVGGASVGGPFATLSQSLPTSLQTALAPIVSSSGLGSSAATARVSSLANSIASAISSSGGSLSVPTFLNLLSSVGAQVSSSSSLSSSSEVTTQVLLEAIAALLQVINGAQITSVNFSNVSNVNRALVDSLVGSFA
ncbi:hypothetical protein HNY73_021739 [Argiope bruennichi]|uniref:Uncharacterized protein n=1 Tax=Argiope bruennichi TaxID=94029 RepID=A0A8T0DZF8_ARGBR|nr:hypothetical protein HNY73_021739 [Argiope bruennichi]